MRGRYNLRTGVLIGTMIGLTFAALESIPTPHRYWVSAVIVGLAPLWSGARRAYRTLRRMTVKDGTRTQ